MARHIHRRGALLGVAGLAALTIGSVGVHAATVAGDTDDHYSPAATQVTGTASGPTATVFTVGPITVTCTNSVAGGKTPATGLGAFPIKPLPVFNDGSASAPCKDSIGFTDTTTTSGTWKIGFKDASLDETKSEPNATGDKLVVTVPIAGAVVHNSAGCIITVAPNAPFKVTGTYNDAGKFVVSINNLPIKVTGTGPCPFSATVSTFNGTYNFTPVVSDAS